MQDFKEKNKNWIQIIGFLAGFCLVLWGVSLLMIRVSLISNDYVQNRNESKIGILKEPDNSIDVIVTGDSLSYTAISPFEFYSEYGITSYDLCQSQQQIQETYSILKTAFKNQKPKVVLLSANSLFLTTEDRDDFDLWLQETMYNLFPAVQLHDMWKPVLAKYYWLEEKTYKGFLFRDVVFPYEGGEYMDVVKEYEPLRNVACKYLDRINEMCKKNGATLMIIATPSPEDWDYAKYLAVKDYSDQNGVAFYDFNLLLTEVGINWKEDSFDGGEHLNLLGAKKVTKYLGKEVLLPFGLENHRNQPGYENWEEEVGYYKQEEEIVLNKMRENFGVCKD